MTTTERMALGLIVSPAFGERGSFTPLGLAYLNGTLRKAGFTPEFFDINEEVRASAPVLHDQLADIGFSPDVGGFFGPDLPLLLELAGRLESDPKSLAQQLQRDVATRLPALLHLDVAFLTLWDSNLYYVAALGLALKRQGVGVVLGGPGATLEGLRRLLIELEVADAVVMGEGEGRVVPLAHQFRLGDEIGKGLKGVTRRGRDGVVVEEPTAEPLRIHDIAEPSFEGFSALDWVPILTSRGCIRDCSFCTEKFFWKRYRQRRVEDVLDELETRIAETGKRSFEFNDDLLNGHIRWLENLCDGILERKLEIRWNCFMEPYRLTPELIERVAEAGCTLIKFGVQHFDRRMLKIIGRGTEISDVVETLVHAAKCGIRVSFDVIPGHPGEAEEHHATNRRVLGPLLRASPLLEVNINPFLLLHGSPVEENPERFGVTIERWKVAHFPDSVADLLHGVDGVFVRKYAQSPPLDLVEERTHELEDLREISQSPHCFGERLVTGDEGQELRLLPPELRGFESVCIRPTETASPRRVLEAIDHLRNEGVARLAIESPWSSLYRNAFLERAREAGVTHWIVRLQGGADEGDLANASEALDLHGYRWWVHVKLERLRELAPEVLWKALRGNSQGLVIDGAEPGSQWTLEDLTELTRVLREGEKRGISVATSGIPACLMEHSLQRILPTSLVRGRGAKRLVQESACRSCQSSPHCPGTTRENWDRLGLRPEPRAGRPIQDLGVPKVAEGWR